MVSTLCGEGLIGLAPHCRASRGLVSSLVPWSTFRSAMHTDTLEIAPLRTDELGAIPSAGGGGREMNFAQGSTGPSLMPEGRRLGSRAAIPRILAFLGTSLSVETELPLSPSARHPRTAWFVALWSFASRGASGASTVLSRCGFSSVAPSLMKGGECSTRWLQARFT